MARARSPQVRQVSRPYRQGSARSRTSWGRHETVHGIGRDRGRASDTLVAKGLLAIVKGIADTGLLVAFANRNDAHHEWAVRLAGQVTEPLLTCEAVLAETAFHLGNAALVLRMVTDGLVAIRFTCDDHLPQLAALAARYADRAPDLADLCLIRMSELYPRHSVITVDRDDFKFYRRNKREIIPLVTPPM